MRKTLGLAWFLALCGAGWVGGSAQAADGGGGPVRFSVEGRGEYTDNRDYSEKNKESTFDFYVTPRVSAGINNEQTVLDVHMAPGIRYRTNPSDYDNQWQWLIDAGVDLQHSITPTVKFRAKDQLYYTDDPSVDSQGKLVRGDLSYFLNTAEAGVNWQFARWTAVDAYGRYTAKRYTDSAASETSDEDRGEFGVMLWRQVLRTAGVKAMGRYYTYGLQAVNGNSRDFDVWVAALGTEVKLSPTFRGGLSAGWTSVAYKDDRLGSDGGPFAELTLNGSLSPAFRLSSALTHSIREASVYPYISQEFTELTARGDWDATGMVTLGLGGGVRQGTYDGENSAMLAGGDETCITVVGDVAVKVTPEGKIRFSQKYEDVDSDVGESYKKNTSSLSYTASF